MLLVHAISTYHKMRFFWAQERLNALLEERKKVTDVAEQQGAAGGRPGAPGATACSSSPHVMKTTL